MKEVYIQWQQDQYEEKGILEYYKSRKQEYTTLYNFIKKREAELNSIGTRNFKFFVEFQKRGVHQDTLTTRIQFIDHNHFPKKEKQYHIANGTLFIRDEPIQGPWKITLNFSKITEVPLPFCTYIHSSYEELNNILILLRDERLELSHTLNGDIEIIYDHPSNGQYSFVYSKTPLVKKNVPPQWRVKEGKVEEGVYWRKIEEIESN